MMSSKHITQEVQLDVDRYVLQDESLDRDAFEARMLENEELALAVADAVAEWGKISAVCRTQAVTELTGLRSPSHGAVVCRAGENRVGGNWGVILATLASVVLVAVLSQISWRPTDSLVTQGPQETPQLTQLAENWIAMTPIEDVTADELLTTAVSDLERAESEEWGDNSDWMVEAAQQFFQELES